MAPRDWKKEKKSVEWDTLSETEWNDYFSYLHATAVEKQISLEKDISEKRRAEILNAAGKPKTIRDIIGKDKPSGIFDWIKIIRFAHERDGLQLTSAKIGDRLRFFSHNGDIQPPMDHFGPIALSFKNAAKEMYDSGAISPPWEKDKVQKMYTRFSQLAKDLTQDPQWNAYWQDLKINHQEELKALVIDDHLDTQMHIFRRAFQEAHPEVTSNITDKRVLEHAGYSSVEAFKEEFRKSIEEPENKWNEMIDNKISDLQQQMLQSYRFKLFSSCQYLQKLPNENDTAYKMREFRVQDFLQQLNKNMRSIEASDKSPKEAVEEVYEKVHQQLTDKLQNTIEHNIKTAKENIKTGTSLENAIATLDKELDKALKSKEVAFLGNEAQPNVDKLIRYKEKLEALQKLIDNNLNEIALAELPGQQSKRESLINKIKAAAHNIAQSEELKALPEVGKVALMNTISSEDAIERIYNNANQKRAEHFYNTFVKTGKTDELGNKETGLGWIKSLRARRDVLQIMHEMALKDKETFKPRSGFAQFFGVKSTKQQQKALETMQDLYFEALHKDLRKMKEDGPQNDGLVKAKIESLSNESIAKVTPSSNFGKVLGNAFNGLIKFFGGKTDQSKRDAKIDGIRNSVLEPRKEVDATSVEMDVTTPLEQTEHRERTQTISKELISELEQHFSLGSRGSEQEEVVIVIKAKPQKCELSRMMQDPGERQNLYGRLQTITDLDERKVMIERLYNETFDNSQGDLRLSSQSLDNRYKNIRVMLQDLYLGAMQEDWQAQVKDLREQRDYQPLTEEEAMQIYQDCIMPEFNSQILNPADETRANSILASIETQRKGIYSNTNAPEEKGPDLSDRKRAVL